MTNQLRRRATDEQTVEFSGAGMKASFRGASTPLLSVLLIAVLLAACAYLVERHEREAEARQAEIIRAVQARCPVIAPGRSGVRD